MNRLTTLALLLLFCGCSTYPPADAKSTDLRRCPDGHQALKDIPIVPLGPPLPPGLSQKIDPALLAQAKRGEIVLGGCIGETTTPICQVCGFRYFHSPHPDHPEMARWERRESDLSNFHTPPGLAMRTFPIIEPSDGKVTFTQAFDPRGRKLEEEKISYLTEASVAEIRPEVENWILRHNLNPGLPLPARGANLYLANESTGLRTSILPPDDHPPATRVIAQLSSPPQSKSE